MSYIVIDDNLRTMTIPSDIVLLGVESDDDVNKIQFQMPREYCGTDLSQFEARINYMNANGVGDIYVVSDLAVDGDDPSLMTFTWIVGRNACAYKGNTQFIVCLKKFADDESGVVLQEFNTTVYQLPVLEGLETTEAVIQQNADIIEQILQRIDDSGMFDPTQYYTKEEVQSLIPTELPNPESLIINGTPYDGSAEVELNIEATSKVTATASGKLVHVVDAIPQAVNSLELYDDNGDPVSSAQIAVTNKNLFRIDLISSSVTSKGVTFTKNEDGSITANGTSTGTYAMTSCNLDKNMFVVGQTYTVSTGKSVGYTYIQLMITYTDNSIDYIVSRNTATTFTITKAVASCVASVQITDSGVTVSNETVYPMLEVGSAASTYVLNEYDSMLFTGVTMPVLPDIISNLWANDDTIENIVMSYEADATYTKIDNYVNANVRSGNVNGTLVVTDDGLGNVTIGLG